jgi:hypothetical protein
MFRRKMEIGLRFSNEKNPPERARPQAINDPWRARLSHGVNPLAIEKTAGLLRSAWTHAAGEVASGVYGLYREVEGGEDKPAGEMGGS